MDKLFIVANLKSEMDEAKAKNWLENFKKINNLNNLGAKEIIIGPSFIHLSLFSSFMHENNIPAKIAAQDVSLFSGGAYTGEVNAKQIKDYASYVIVGHSERRSNFKESDDMLFNKVKNALANGINPIYCVESQDTLVPQGITILAYEPVFAIGSGNPDTPENAEAIAKALQEKNSNYSILYGGSVNSQNVKSFTEKENINGILVGGASLDAEEFIQIIQNA